MLLVRATSLLQDGRNPAASFPPMVRVTVTPPVRHFGPASFRRLSASADLESDETSLPSGAWVPTEFTVVRGPIQVGLTTYRCEAVADPRYHFLFTGAVPPLMAAAALVAFAVVAAAVWTWAVGPSGRHAGPTTGPASYDLL